MVTSHSDHLTALSGSGIASAVAEPVPTMKQVLARYAPYLAGCRAAIVHDMGNAPMGGTLSEYFGRGKMLRPLLLFAAAAAVGGDPSLAIPAAQSLELLHGASLIHDDIIDRSKERRGRKSLHLLVGVGPAVVLGDYLILRSQSVLAQIDSPRVLEAIQVLSRCAEDCCRGQVEELVSASEEDDESRYFSIVRRKTASPFVAAATMGGILGDGRAHQIHALREYALNLGICFQMRDDELDLTDDSMPSLASKSTRHSPPTLPVIYLQQHGSKGACKKYRQIQRDGAKRQELLAFLCAEGITQRLTTVKEFHLNQALEAAQGFLDPSEMTAMAYDAIHRDA